MSGGKKTEHISKKIIGLHQYNQLKKFSTHSEEEKQLIKDFETISISPEKLQAHLDYLRKVKQSELNENKIIEVTADHIKKIFGLWWVKLEGKEFVNNHDTIENLKTLVYYFAKDPKFFNQSNLRTEFNFSGTRKYSDPSFDKGLLIIGGFGNGKTSMMKVFSRCFQGTKGWFFKSYNANDLVEIFETADGPVEKREFWQKMERERIYLDDMKTEKVANNYGKANLFREVLEKRYNRGLFKTHLTANYSDDYPNDLNEALLEFSDMYGNRVFDRLFHMYNIIEFTGKSFRR